MERQAAAMDRPWISVIVAVEHRGLSFATRGNTIGSASIPFAFKLQNVGHSVAGRGRRSRGNYRVEKQR